MTTDLTGLGLQAALVVAGAGIATRGAALIALRIAQPIRLGIEQAAGQFVLQVATELAGTTPALPVRPQLLDSPRPSTPWVRCFSRLGERRDFASDAN
jgi:hypothetical protein